MGNDQPDPDVEAARAISPIFSAVHAAKISSDAAHIVECASIAHKLDVDVSYDPRGQLLDAAMLHSPQSIREVAVLAAVANYRLSLVYDELEQKRASDEVMRVIIAVENAVHGIAGFILSRGDRDLIDLFPRDLAAVLPELIENFTGLGTGDIDPEEPWRVALDKVAQAHNLVDQATDGVAEDAAVDAATNFRNGSQIALIALPATKPEHVIQKMMVAFFVDGDVESHLEGVDYPALFREALAFVEAAK